MVDVTEILMHWYAGRSKAEIAASLDLDRKTVRKYTKRGHRVRVQPGQSVQARSVDYEMVSEAPVGDIDRDPGDVGGGRPRSSGTAPPRPGTRA